MANVKIIPNKQRMKFARLTVGDKKYLVEAQVRRATPIDRIDFEIEDQQFTVDYFTTKDNEPTIKEIKDATIK